MMYRDEREALRDEVMQLRRELEQAKSGQERLAKLEQLLEMANREVVTLRGQMGGAPPRRPGSSATLIAVAAVGILAIGAAGFFLTARVHATSTSTAPAPQKQEVEATADPPAPTPMPPPTATPATVATAEAPAKPSRSAHAIWHASVTKSQGMSLAAGTSCTVAATVTSDASGTGVDDVIVTCGGKKLYDANDELGGMSSTDSDMKQFDGDKKGTWTYGMAYSDVGARSPTRNQTAIDSTKQIGKVWSDNLPDFRVDFTIKTKSDPVDVEVETE